MIETRHAPPAALAPEANNQPETPPRTSSAAQTGRSVALDALRGLTVAAMLLVNNVALGEFTPAQLTHAPWGGGVYFADLVFPWFLFCAGAALPFAWASARKRGLAYTDWLRKSVVRAVMLVLIGCFLTSVVAHAPVFSLGVLQLIGLAGLVAALCEPLRPTPRLGLALALLVVYWAFLRFAQLPGADPGEFAPGRNPAASLNAWLEPLGLRGLPSVIPTAALVMIGSLIGGIVRQNAAPRRKITVLALAGLGMIALGLVWNLDLEFNKAHWTPAYILFGAGTATLILSAFSGLEHRIGSRWFRPLEVFGVNALLGYVLPIVIKIWILQDWQVSANTSVQDWALGSLITAFGRQGGGWVYTFGYILVWWLVMFELYRRKVFWRV